MRQQVSKKEIRDLVKETARLHQNREISRAHFQLIIKLALASEIELSLAKKTSRKSRKREWIGGL